MASLPNLSSIEFWAQPAEDGSGGYWAATRFEDIQEVSRDTERFVSGRVSALAMQRGPAAA